jgi:S-adenosylmethionine decarboxylase proenzyme
MASASDPFIIVQAGAGGYGRIRPDNGNDGMNGLHILAEFHDCACAAHLLREVAALRELCLSACGAPGLTVVAEAFHGFGTAEAPAGATGAVVLAESHLAVHTWPETAGVTVDLYVCNFSQDNRAAAEAAFQRLRAAFQPGRFVRRDILRGQP